MSQANVYTSVSNAVWYTDKCEIVTGNAAVTYNIYEVSTVQPILFGGYLVSGNANINTTLNTTANIIGATVTVGNGIANATTVSSVTTSANGAITLITLNNAATSTIGNASAFVQYTLTLPPNGNLYSAAPQVAASSRQQIYVGAGNKLTITGSGFTAREIGTASSATAGF
jgi:hypothetical protein